MAAVMPPGLPRLTDLEFVNLLREWEITSLVEQRRDLFAGKDLLEIGSGGGAQLRVLQTVCRTAVGIENEYRMDRLAQIIDYDGRHIPFPDHAFDVLFSSHVLEHIADQEGFHREMHRVLRPHGVGVHIVPSAAWRFWASVSHYPGVAQKAIRKLVRASAIANHAPAPSQVARNAGSRWKARLSYGLIQRRHGEHGTWFTEHFLFQRQAWQMRLEANGWKLLCVEPFGVVMTGNYLLNERLSFPARRRLARLMGVSSFLFVTTPL
jgi:SAM-dependent methyltransferase